MVKTILSSLLLMLTTVMASAQIAANGTEEFRRYGKVRRSPQINETVATK